MALPSSSFSPPSRAGFALGRTPAQVALAVLALAVWMVPVFFGGSVVAWRALVCVPVIVFAVLNVKGESVLGIVGRFLGFNTRRLLGWTQWTASPMAAGREVGVLDLPGANGERTKPVAVVGTPYDGACFLWDKVSGEATACLLMAGTQWRYTPDTEKADRAAGWTRAMERISAMEGVVRVVTQARCLPAPASPSPDLPEGLAARDLREVESSQLAVTPAPDMVMTVTVSTKALKGRVSREGGGVEGVSRVLADVLGEVVAGAAAAGADRHMVQWMNLPALRGQVRRLTSRDALDVLDKDGQLPDRIPMVSSVAEYDRSVRVGDVWAASMWIDQWPADPVWAGWLEDALCTGFGTAPNGTRMVLSLAWHGVDEDKATKTLDRRINELNGQITMSARTGTPPSDRAVNELRDSRQRKAELAQGMSATAFKGVVTLIADDEASLEEAVSVASRSLGAHGGMHAERYYGRQWQLFCTALPFGFLGRSGL